MASRVTTKLALGLALICAIEGLSCKSRDDAPSASNPGSGGTSGGTGGTAAGGTLGGSGGATSGGEATSGGTGGDGGGGASSANSETITSGSVSGAGGDNGYAWIDDPSAWRTPDEVGPCRPSSALISKLDFPGSEWTSCGEGCRRVKPIKGPATVIADNWRSGMRVSGGIATVSLSLGILTEPRIPLLALFELDDDLVLKSLMKQTVRGCVASFVSRHSPMTVNNVVSDTADDRLEEHIGRIANDGLIQWLEPPNDRLNLAGFDFEGGWGAIWGDKELTVATNASSTAQSSLYASPGNIVQPRSNGKRLTFGEWRSDSGAILSWSPGGTQVEEMAAGAWDVMDVALSETSVVWLSATGPRTWEGSYESATLRWMSLDTRDYNTDQAIELPITRGGTQLATNGHWASLRGCEGDVCGIYLVNVSTKELWRGRPASGRVWESFGLFDDRVFISESTPDDPLSYFSSLLEYRTEAFIAGAELL